MLLKSGTVTTTRAAKCWPSRKRRSVVILKKLEADGHLIRKHGGAVGNNDIRRDLSLKSRQIANCR